MNIFRELKYKRYKLNKRKERKENPRKGAGAPSYIDRIPRGAAAHVLAKETSTTFQHLPSSLIPTKEI